MRIFGDHRSGERGFVLIAAIWLLILAGSITAVLMLRSLASATAAADRSDAVEARLALESAVETMLADRLFNSVRSRWWLVPAEGSILVGGRAVSLRLTSESGRLDVNNADPALIDAALRGLGIGDSDRRPVIARITALRTMKQVIRSASEMDSLVAGVRTPPGLCLDEHLTFVSGLAEPRPDQMPAGLARALGRAGAGANGSGPTEGGAALRIEALESGGSSLVSIVRITGLPDRPYAVSVWRAQRACAASGPAGRPPTI